MFSRVYLDQGWCRFLPHTAIKILSAVTQLGAPTAEELDRSEPARDVGATPGSRNPVRADLTSVDALGYSTGRRNPTTGDGRVACDDRRDTGPKGVDIGSGIHTRFNRRLHRCRRHSRLILRGAASFNNRSCDPLCDHAAER